jgi:hypothetical protein
VDAAADARDAPIPADTGVDGKADAVADAGCGEAGATCERVVFATSTTSSGNGLGGVAGADARCQARADGSTHVRVRGKRFRAWISTKQSAVKDRLVHGTAPYKLPSGAIIAASFADLTDGSLLEGIDEDENGANVGGNAWTGSNADGTLGPDECDGWTASGTNGRAGNVGGKGAGWSDGTNASCGQSFRLYCFEE